MPLTVQREGKQLPPLSLTLPAGWRETDISWRAGQGSVPPILGFWEQPLTPEERQQSGLPADGLALRVTSLFVGEKWAGARGPVQVGDVLLGMDGKSLPRMSARQFHTYYRLHHAPGDHVTLQALRNGQRLELTLTAVDVRVE
jgi:S1-C subfamily serine protease